MRRHPDEWADHGRQTARARPRDRSAVVRMDELEQPCGVRGRGRCVLVLEVREGSRRRLRAVARPSRRSPSSCSSEYGGSRKRRYRNGASVCVVADADGRRGRPTPAHDSAPCRSNASRSSGSSEPSSSASMPSSRGLVKYDANGAEPVAEQSGAVRELGVRSVAGSFGDVLGAKVNPSGTASAQRRKCSSAGSR